jgi:hypothetical protein
MEYINFLPPSIRGMVKKENYCGFWFREESLRFAVVVLVLEDQTRQVYRDVPSFSHMIEIPEDLEFELFKCFPVTHSFSNENQHEIIQVTSEVIQKTINSYHRKLRKRQIAENDDITIGFCQ